MSLQDEIISCLWSAGLKRHIREIGYTFTDTELLGIAYRHAPNFDERLRLLQLLADTSDHACRCIAWQQQCLEQFRRLDDHEIYELRIQDPEYCEDRYLCASFDTALELIDRYREEYDFAPETPVSRYVIEKRKINQPGQPFREEDPVTCTLGAGKVLLWVDAPGRETENGPCPSGCADCTNLCMRNLDVRFPSHLSDRAVVRYRLRDGSLHYGIHLTSVPDEITDSYYIIPLDGEMLRCGSMDEFWDIHDHEHIPCPDVDAVPISQLPSELRESYDAFLAWLDDKTK